MSGKNPFWNYDYNAAQRNREIVDSYQQANEARLNSQQAQFEASMANDEVNHLQLRLNQTISSHKKVVDRYEQQLEGFKNNFSALHYTRIFFIEPSANCRRNGPTKRNLSLTKCKDNAIYVINRIIKKDGGTLSKVITLLMTILISRSLSVRSRTKHNIW